jgi:organic radical activating enzyme
MHHIPTKVDFYITNVCNLTCNNCNRFNNHHFTGWQRWSDYEKIYESWGELVSLRAITIMGGEPFLNPTLKQWVEGLNRIFGIEVQVLTNGTRLRQNKDLYSSMLYRSPKNNALNHIGISLHNVKDFEEFMKDDIYDFLQAPVAVYEKGHEKNKWNSDWHFVDSNGIIVNVYTSNNFGTAAIRQTQPQHFVLHNSDVELAHQNCAFVQWKSYHFIRGKLYKCGPVALMPEFDQQHQFDISDEDRELLNSYQALSVDNFETYYRDFFDNIDRPIAQCKFCPSEHKFETIYPLRKGLAAAKYINIDHTL